MNWNLILLVLAAFCFVLSAANVGGKISLTPLGLFFWVLTLLM